MLNKNIAGVFKQTPAPTQTSFLTKIWISHMKHDFGINIYFNAQTLVRSVDIRQFDVIVLLPRDASSSC